MISKIKVYDINEKKSIAKQLSIDDRKEGMYKNQSYMAIRDHNEHLPNKISCRLIGKTSETILDKLNTEIVSLTNVNQ